MSHRYPGTNPFTNEQEDLFFGREADIKEFAQKFLIYPVTILYSKSGLGKSSMINAGLLPLFFEKGFVPFVIRFRPGAINGNKSLIQILRDTIQNNFQVSTFLDKIIPQENSLWYHIKSRQIITKKHKYVLIFDQFEEIFTYPKAEINRFKLELTEAISSDVPQRFYHVLDFFSNGQTELLNDDEDLVLNDPFELRIIFVVRSDKLHLLDQLSDVIPRIFDNTYQLQSLTLKGAKEAIVSPAEIEEGFESPPFKYAEESVEKIINFLADEEQRIETIQLQIICESIEKKVIREKLKLITPKEIGNLESIIENYYHDKVAEIGNLEDQLSARKFIEEGLVLEEEKQRISVHKGHIAKFFPGITDELLERLVGTRLIRGEKISKGGYVYELSHDTLIKPVLKAKNERKEKERREEEIKKLAEVEQKLKIERKLQQRRLAIGFGIIGIFLAALTTILAIYAFNSRSEAEVSKQQAEKLAQQLTEAINARKKLETPILVNEAFAYANLNNPTGAKQKMEEAVNLARETEDSILIIKVLSQRDSLYQKVN